MKAFTLESIRSVEALVQEISSGSRAVTVIEFRKEPEQYHYAMSCGLPEGIKGHARIGQEGAEVILYKHDESLQTYLYLLREGASMPREVLQMLMGAIFGYDYDSCNEYINSETGKTCDCSKCRGEIPWAVRTQEVNEKLKTTSEKYSVGRHVGEESYARTQPRY